MAALLQREDRLIVDLELLPLDRAAEVVLELQLRQDLAAHLAGEDLRAAAAGDLGAIHRRVGVAQELRRGLRSPSCRARCRSSTVTKSSRSPIAKECVKAACIAARDLGGFVELGDLFEEHRELVAAQPRHRIAGADARFDPSGDRHEELVADRMPEAVVDHLEAVEVEEEHARRGCDSPRLARARARSRRSRKSARFGRPVSGSWTLRSVMSVCEPAMRQGLPSLALERDAARQHPAVVAIAVFQTVLVLEHLGGAGEVAVEAGAQSRQVFGMDAREPRVGRRRTSSSSSPSIDFQRFE